MFGYDACEKRLEKRTSRFSVSSRLRFGQRSYITQEGSYFCFNDAFHGFPMSGVAPWGDAEFLLRAALHLVALPVCFER